MANTNDNKVFLILEDCPILKQQWVLMLKQHYGREFQIDFCDDGREAIKRIQHTNAYTDAFINIALCLKYGVELDTQQIEAAACGVNICWLLGKDEVRTLMRLKGITDVAGNTTSNPKTVK